MTDIVYILSRLPVHDDWPVVIDVIRFRKAFSVLADEIMNSIYNEFDSLILEVKNNIEDLNNYDPEDETIVYLRDSYNIELNQLQTIRSMEFDLNSLLTAFTANKNMSDYYRFSTNNNEYSLQMQVNSIINTY